MHIILLPSTLVNVSTLSARDFRNIHSPESILFAVLRTLQWVSPSLWLDLLTILDSSLVLRLFLNVQSLVEDDDSLSSDQDSNDGQSDRDEDQTSTKLIQWLLVSEKEVWSEPMRSSTKGVGDSDQGGFLVSRTWDQLGFPRDLDVETREDTHDEEADSGVSYSDVKARNQHDSSDS